MRRTGWESGRLFQVIIFGDNRNTILTYESIGVTRHLPPYTLIRNITDYSLSLVALFMIILTTWYPEKNPRRQTELLQALAANIRLSPIWIYCEGTSRPGLPGNCITVDHRPTYADCLKDHPVKLVCLVNTDCHLVAIPRLPQAVLDGKQAWCLSRDDIGHDAYCAHDAWIFKVPEGDRLTALLARCGMTFGKPGCDCSFNAALCKTGFQLRNPCKDVILRHCHASGIRNYDKTRNAEWATNGLPYRLVSPCRLSDCG